MFDLISIGDATIDNFIQVEEDSSTCKLDKVNGRLCVEYGSKIPVKHFRHGVGGNAVHSAIGASGLNLKSAIYVNVGDDYSGKRVIEDLRENGVNTRYVSSNKNMETNFSAVLTYQDERTIFVYHQDWKYQLPDLDSSKWVYFTSLSKSFIQSNIIKQLCSYLERTGAKMLYNPGTFQIKNGIKKDSLLLSLTQVFIVNYDEARKILEIKEEKANIKKILKQLADLGPKMVVITDGSKGAYGFDGQNFYFMPIFPAKLKEKTGAGDAFATGVLAGLFYKKELKESLRWGACNGAAVIEQIGPREGLLSYQKIQERLKLYKNITAEEF